MVKTGKLISFEGGEGSGKSTQAKLLHEYFIANGVDCILTREPGGCEASEQIREILVQGKGEKLDAISETLLHYTARREHLRQLIAPALASGKIVITDRFIDSTVAYQGYGHGVDREIINKIADICIGDFKPDLTLIFKIDIKEGLARANARRGVENRYENMDISFHQRVMAGFEEIAKLEKNRCFLVDASKNIDDVRESVLKIIDIKNFK